MNLRSACTVIALSAVTALSLASCANGATNNPSGGSGSDGRLQVVATTTQLSDFAAQVGGSDIELTGLMTPGASAHGFDPSPADLIALGQADVLIVNGAGLDDFIDSAIESSGFNGTIIDASRGVDLGLASEITRELAGATETAGSEDAGTAHDHHEHSHEHDDHSDHGDDHSHEHGDHDHGELNPHLWTSVHFAEGMVHEISHGLGEADPTKAEAYEKRAHAYMEKLAALDAWISEQYAQIPVAERMLVTGHDSLSYYLHDYDITFVGAILPSFEDNAEPSAAQIDELIAAIQAHGVKAIFVESSISPKLAQTVGKEAGVQVIDEATLFVDSLGTEGSGAENYISATAHNTRVILESWGANVADLPAELG